MNVIHADKVIDATGLFCPLPMIKVRRAIRTMSPGEVLELTATDEGVVSDVHHWVQQNQHELLCSDRRPDGIFYFLNRKSK